MGFGKNKRKNISKADLTEFFLLYNERYSNLMRVFLFYCILYFCLQVLVFITSINLEGLYVLMVVIIIMLGIYSRKELSLVKYRKADPERSEDFVSYLVGAKRKKSINEVLNKIGKIQRKKFPIQINILGKILQSYELFVGYSGAFLVLIIYGIRVYPITEKYGVLFIIGFIVLLLLSISLIEIFLTLLDYRDIQIYSKLFKNYVENKLTMMKERLDLFIKTKTVDISTSYLDLLPILQSWYEFYCSRYSSNEKVNEVVSNYHSLIFRQEDEYKYLETFVSVNGKLNDKINSLGLNDDSPEEEIKILEKNRNYLSNYIDLLEKNVKRKSQQEKEILTRRKNKQIQFFYLFSIFNLIISIVSITISFILLFK